MKIYAVPHLYCPFPVFHSKYEKEIEKHTNLWVLDMQLARDAERVNYYRDQNFAKMISCSYPEGGLWELCVWCDMNTLLFILDDQLDEQGMMNTRESLIAFTNIFLGILENKMEVVESDGVILFALQDWWKKVRQKASPAFLRKFLQGIKDMFAGGMWQLQHQNTMSLPSSKEYMKVRQFLGAANLATDSVELTANVILNEKVYHEAYVYRLTELCRNTICFANDLFSFSKEAEQSMGGAEFNLVSILRREMNISIEEAILETARIHDAGVRDFEKIANNIMQDTTVDTMLNHYIKALQNLMIGNIEWSTKYTTRYPHVYY